MPRLHVIACHQFVRGSIPNVDFATDANGYTSSVPGESGSLSPAVLENCCLHVSGADTQDANARPQLRTITHRENMFKMRRGGKTP